MTRRIMELGNAKLGLIVMGIILFTEVVGYIVMMALLVTVPQEYLSFMYATLMALGTVAGVQWYNGKTAPEGMAHTHSAAVERFSSNPKQ